MLMRTDPYRDFDRLFTQLAGTRTPAMPMDAYRHGDTVVLHLDMPGVDPGSIELHVERNVLSVKAERTWHPVEGDEVLATERSHGKFSRQVFLSDTLDTGAIHASYDNGVLTVTIPLSDRAKPRRIQVASSASGPAAIETGTASS